MKRRTVAALLLAGAAGAFAQGSWPDKPITMIVPFPPGGVADTVARPVAEALSRELKTPVVIKPGRDEPWTPFRLIQAFITAGVQAAKERVVRQ